MRKGTKFNRNMDVVDIAKMARKDIKAAQADGYLPATMKTSVTTQRFSGGESINITVTALPGVAIFCAPDPDDNRRNCYTPEVAAILQKLNDLLMEYNYDNSDSQTDYFDTNFYHSIQIDWSLRGQA